VPKLRMIITHPFRLGQVRLQRDKGALAAADPGTLPFLT
jgi:hypothetical protein